jgi:DNA-binding protein HU-beta
MIERLATEHGTTKDQTKKILDTAFAAIAAAASAGEDVTLAGFGRFRVIDRAERQGRNPTTGETITIAASKKLFLCSGQKHPRCPECRRSGSQPCTITGQRMSGGRQPYCDREQSLDVLHQHLRRGGRLALFGGPVVR